MESPNKTAEKFKITGNWTNQSKALRQKYSELTDHDVKFEAGKEEELLKRMQTRLNKGRDEVINIIKKTTPKTV